MRCSGASVFLASFSFSVSSPFLKNPLPSPFFLSFFHTTHKFQVSTYICNRTSCPSLAGFDPSLWLLPYLHQRYSESQEKKVNIKTKKTYQYKRDWVEQWRSHASSPPPPSPRSSLDHWTLRSPGSKGTSWTGIVIPERWRNNRRKITSTGRASS